MNTRCIIILALIAAFWPVLPSLMAQGKGQGNPHANRNFDDDDDRWERRDGYEYRTYGDQDGRPPGWSRGKKTGWGNCGLPPGQAKKYGCRTYVYEGRPHYYYEDDEGRTVIRRPVVEVHGSVDGVFWQYL